MEELIEFLPLLIGVPGMALLFGILINPMFWQGFRNNYWLDKQNKERRQQHKDSINDLIKPED